ncbi:MAG: helix-turn-helix transcriptional regulator [bacterium]
MLDMERDVQMMLGMNIRCYRQRIGLSQEALADKAGIHRNYLGGVERGKRNICLLNIAKIATALGVEPCQLLMHDRANCKYIIE